MVKNWWGSHTGTKLCCLLVFLAAKSKGEDGLASALKDLEATGDDWTGSRPVLKAYNDPSRQESELFKCRQHPLQDNSYPTPLVVFVQCPFFDKTALHSKMPLVPTPARFSLLA
jgi:hypothetical protein